jgi:hypothetical protein
MRLLGRFEVWPHYHQVEVRDVGEDVDCPQWESGDEPALAADRCLVLATRPDLDGTATVTVELWAGPIDTAQPGAVVFDGTLLTTGACLLVGSSITGELHEVPMPAGWHRVRVSADPPASPERLVVVGDDATVGQHHDR